MKYIVIMLICMIPALGNAEPELKIAFKGGPNAATLDHEYRVNRYGFSGGLAGHLGWPVDDRFSLGGQIDLLYTPRGAEVVADGVLQGKFRQNYVDVMLAARPGVRFGPASLYLLLGGGINLLASAHSENSSGTPQDATEYLRRIDVALLAGGGVALHLPRRGSGPFRLGDLFLEVRHDHGLIDIDRMDAGFKNRSSSLMLGLSFALGSEVSPPPESTAPAPATAK